MEDQQQSGDVQLSDEQLISLVLARFANTPGFDITLANKLLEQPDVAKRLASIAGFAATPRLTAEQLAKVYEEFERAQLIYHIGW